MMKKAAILLLGLNLLVLVILGVQVAAVKISDYKEGGKSLETQSESVKTTPQTEDTVKKKVALTFDDGPDPDYTEKLLDGLKKRDVKATFFCWENRRTPIQRL